MKIIVWTLDINHWKYRWASSEAGRPAANGKVRSSTSGPAWNLLPLEPFPLPEKPMAYIWDW